MSWGKVDDQWFHHRKVVGLSLASRGLWVTTLSWSCANKTPVVPAGMTTFLAACVADDQAAELVDAGLWHRADHHCEACDNPPPGGYVIHDWPEYQERTLSEKRADAGAKGGRAGTGASKRRTEGKQTANTPQANAKQERKQVSRPDPTYTQPTTNPLSPDGDDGRALRLIPLKEPGEDVAARFEEFWTAFPKHHLTGRIAGGGSKKPALRNWRKLTREQRDACLVAVRHYRDECEALPDRSVKQPEGWLTEERWITYAEPVTVRARGRPAHAASDATDEERHDAARWN